MPVRNAFFARGAQTPEDWRQLENTLPKIDLILMDSTTSLDEDAMPRAEARVAKRLGELLPTALADKVREQFRPVHVRGEWAILERRPAAPPQAAP